MHGKKKGKMTMAEKYTTYMSEKQKVKEITDKLEEGLQELFESNTYKNYLTSMSKFHNYSFNNTLLITMQKPEATLVAGYQAWQNEFERHVNKGEKAIRILAPAPYKIKEERDKLDPVTGEMMLDENGMPQKEETEVTIPAFRVVSVFDVSQTDGKPIPELVTKELLSTVEGYEDFVQALESISPVPIEFEDIPGDSKGYFSPAEKRIAVQENMSESQTTKTMVHEVAHSMLHDREINQGSDIPAKDRNTKEVEAESIAFTVCQHFGIDTTEYSFGYIAGWSSGKDMKELKSSLDTIRKTASELIIGIEGRLEELQLNREIEKEQRKESILLIQNEDLTQYSLVSIRGMDQTELVSALSSMNEMDRGNIMSYLEGKGAWTTELANEQTEEVKEYHLDLRYNTDSGELTDIKEKLEQQTNIKLILMDEQEHEYQYPFPVVAVDIEEMGGDRTAIFRSSEPISDTVIAEIHNGFHGTDLEWEIQRELGVTWVESIMYEDGSIMTPEMERVENNISNQSVQKNDLKPEIEEDEIIDLGDETEQVLAEMKKTLEREQETELAFSIADRYIRIQEMEGGYDYSIMSADYKEIDGGIYDNPDVTIREALDDILEDLKSQPDYNGAKGNIQREDELMSVDYDELMEKAEEVNRIIPESTTSSTVADFKAKTEELFHDISELNPAEIEETVKCHVQAKLDEYGIDAVIVDVAVVGSRCRGLEREDSDLDIVVELSTREREDDLFNAFNEDGLHIGTVKVDINPITSQRTGTLETYLPQVEAYLAEIQTAREQEIAQKIQQTSGHDVQKPEPAEKEVEVTLTVAECGEFHNLGEFYENIPTVDEAIAIWKQIPPERMNGIPAIGIHLHRPGEEYYMDDEIDLLYGNRIDLEILEHIPGMKKEPKAMEMVTELVAKFPDMEIDGVLSEEMETNVWEKRMPDLSPAEQLAVAFDRFTYAYDTSLYHDSTRNMTENVADLAERICQGDSGELTDWLKEIIADGAVPEETEQAKELLEKLAEYKPLAKIEELEEQNYNMIDNVLNNGAEKFHKETVKREHSQSSGKMSLKARLAEKKAQIGGQTQDNQENEKNRQREV